MTDKKNLPVLIVRLVPGQRCTRCGACGYCGDKNGQCLACLNLGIMWFHKRRSGDTHGTKGCTEKREREGRVPELQAEGADRKHLRKVPTGV